MSLRELYQEIIVDHGRQPRNFGQLMNANHSQAGHNPLCGDKLTIYLIEQNGVIDDVRFEVAGCAISVASGYIKKMLEKKQGKGFRLSIKKTGCSGYSYVPEIVDQINPLDAVHETEGVTVYLDTTWLHLLQGLHIDYLEEDKSGLKQKR